MMMREHPTSLRHTTQLNQGKHKTTTMHHSLSQPATTDDDPTHLAHTNAFTTTKHTPLNQTHPISTNRNHSTTTTTKRNPQPNTPHNKTQPHLYQTHSTFTKHKPPQLNATHITQLNSPEHN